MLKEVANLYALGLSNTWRLRVDPFYGFQQTTPSTNPPRFNHLLRQ